MRDYNDMIFYFIWQKWETTMKLYFISDNNKKLNWYDIYIWQQWKTTVTWHFIFGNNERLQCHENFISYNNGKLQRRDILYLTIM